MPQEKFTVDLYFCFCFSPFQWNTLRKRGRGHPCALDAKRNVSHAELWMEGFFPTLTSAIFIHRALEITVFLHCYCRSFENTGAGLVQGFENMWQHFACWCWYSVFSRVPLFWIVRNLKDTIVTFLITDSPLSGTLFCYGYYSLFSNKCCWLTICILSDRMISLFFKHSL